ncbi:hypothetical protein L226DRAFT_568645 [Lentinus tigrinus ALCF2SS1-7]|uniref:Uncharacterized protein n=1 Tax=Lentinus tigrinus ALCF2SS1-6 TaxID=1328759 RepID=A0A5C2SFR8_9APHY|nr:hypothetical protein L227DRAFT_609213 [Lentinus tigrinus ALCF2SS1-6]RPD77610.1 hypothetical protein L226DRAFT_568645 [Lentinus tigrinus ALCF2SS1-7]
MLSSYLSPQSRKNLRFLQSKEELQEMLADIGFRPEVIPLATYADEVLPHGVAESWVSRFARQIYAIS